LKARRKEKVFMVDGNERIEQYRQLVPNIGGRSPHSYHRPRNDQSTFL
jgi:hypothetical protein